MIDELKLDEVIRSYPRLLAISRSYGCESELTALEASRYERFIVMRYRRAIRGDWR